MSEDSTKLVLSDPQSSSIAMMKQLANNDDSQDIIDINGEKLIGRTKLFLVVQARNSLNRIIRLTTFLEKLEDKFIEAVTARVEDNPNDITTISLAMETLSKCLEDANATVMQVLKDDKLQQIVINTTNIITPDGKAATVIDPQSRDEIRNLAGSLLSQLSKIAIQDQEGSVVELDEIEEET